MSSTPGNDQYGPPPGYEQQGGYGQPYGARPRNGAGLASLILGVIGLLLCWLLGIGIVPGLIGLVLGIVGMRRARRGEATNRGVAIAGVVTSAIAVVASAVFLALTIAVGSAFWNNGGADLTQCLRDAGGDVAAQQQCQQDFNEDLGVDGDQTGA
ncbi:DUF4190 domain-containing protein [Kineococcus indalonis]|uniref:DUF4190 domain-containing protein n=1 Tax=Kineococcus indalonis TaxID=2696566 RepID=UPI0014135363|nr:DUF4190 domain-containing protein [Kineococcus indalonis]NAZ85826.1 DUF4190 domain-containing protein [Kineococcus indalonis]